MTSAPGVLEAADAPVTERRTPFATSVAIAAAVTAVDQLTKHWAVNALDDGRAIDVVGSLRFKLFFNSGMAFSQGEGIGPLIGVLALVIVAGLLVSLRRNAGVLSTVATGLVVGGAAGNIIDRLFRGRGWLRGSVVDFIDLQWWPVFNVADMAVTIGGALVLLGAMRSREPATR